MSILNEFMSLEEALYPLNVYPIWDQSNRYYCTPLQYQMFAGLGVDGIHFCYRESSQPDHALIIVVSPGAECEVTPVAETITDFIRLLITTGDAGSMEAAANRSLAEYQEYEMGGLETLHEYPEQKQGADAAIARLKEMFGVHEMADLYGYIQDMKQKYANLTFTFDAEDSFS